MSIARLAGSVGGAGGVGGSRAKALLREEFRAAPVHQDEALPPHARAVPTLYTLKGPEKVRWAHAVNSLEALNQTLQAGEAHFVEADVATSAHDPEAAVMAHGAAEAAGKARGADSFEAWIRAVVSNNIHSVQRGARAPLGVKLDFKDENAARLALAQLAELRGDVKGADTETPLWLNADVLSGPNGGPPRIDADWFVIQCLRAEPAAVLSLGWTTSGEASACQRLCGRSAQSCWLGRVFGQGGKGAAGGGSGSGAGEGAGEGAGDGAPLPPAGSDPASPAGSYTDAMVDDMLEVCERYSLTQVTFAVRFMYVQRSRTQMLRLLNHCPSYSLTVFSTGHDADPDTAWLADNLPPGRVFVDAGGSPKV